MTFKKKKHKYTNTCNAVHETFQMLTVKLVLFIFGLVKICD